jgi:hypothetical protein
MVLKGKKQIKEIIMANVSVGFWEAYRQLPITRQAMADKRGQMR